MVYLEATKKLVEKDHLIFFYRFKEGEATVYKRFRGSNDRILLLILMHCMQMLRIR